MNLYGEKVVLRAIELEDRQLLLDMINDPDTERMIGGFSFPVSALNQARWIENLQNNNGCLRCIVAAKEQPEKGLGTVILSDMDMKNGIAQAHIKMAVSEARGKGYGTDALRTLVRYAFRELRLHCVYAEVLEYNTASRRLFEKCGFQQDGVLRGRVFKDGAYINVIPYSVLNLG